ncbi:hypothetical protein CCAL13119_07075 [Campylobacter sp. RM13119]|nr:hypothetical protein [Campylobacter sp. RM13119]MBE3606704.1 hypothetical protein [Campylobacter sp. RM13119]
MKPFFYLAKIYKRARWGSVEFSINFTQDMDILPFIKRWLPDIEILDKG